MRKIIALVLLTVTLMTVVLGCKEEKDDPDTTNQGIGTQGTGTAEAQGPDVPVFDGDGSELIFLVRVGSTSYDDIYVFGEEKNGSSVLDEAIYKRNQYAEEKFNVEMTEFASPTPASQAYTFIQANEDAFDVLDDRLLDMTALTGTSGNLIDFNEVPYVDLTQSYWAGSNAGDLSLGEKILVAPSMISMRNLNDSMLIYFSKQVIEESKLTSPYEYVEKDEWVLETFYKMIAAAPKDLNGDGEMTKDDRYGLLVIDNAAGGLQPFIYGAGFRVSEKDEDDYPTVDFGDEKLITFLQDYYAVFSNKATTIDYSSAAAGENTTGYRHLPAYVRSTKFVNNQYLFFADGIDDTKELTEMTTGYGVVPMPKYDDRQENYYAIVDAYSTKFAIPATNTRLEETGIFLEWLSWKSEELVLPAYYEVTLKDRRLEDDEAKESLDIVRQSMTHEITDLFDLDITAAFWNAFKGNEYASTFEAYRPVIERKLQKVIENLENAE